MSPRLPDTCCMNVGGPAAARGCGLPATRRYRHNDVVCSYCGQHDYVSRREQVRAARPGDLAVLVSVGTPVMQVPETAKLIAGPTLTWRATCSLPNGATALVVQVLSEGTGTSDGTDKLLVVCEGRLGYVDWVDVERIEKAEVGG